MNMETRHFLREQKSRILYRARRTMEQILEKVRDDFQADLDNESKIPGSSDTILIPWVNEHSDGHDYLDCSIGVHSEVFQDNSWMGVRFKTLASFYYDRDQECLMVDIDRDLEKKIATELEELEKVAKIYEDFMDENCDYYI